MSTPQDEHKTDRPRGRLSGPSATPEGTSVPTHHCVIAESDEPLGGDPPCWAHLFEDDDDPAPADR